MNMFSDLDLAPPLHTYFVKFILFYLIVAVPAKSQPRPPSRFEGKKTQKKHTFEEKKNQFQRKKSTFFTIIHFRK